MNWHFSGDGRNLVIANGGIRTHPGAPREKLNLPTMAPSLAYVDAASGTLRATHTLDHHFLGIRHLAVGPGDLVCVALQHEGPLEDAPPLVGFQRGEEPNCACWCAAGCPEKPQSLYGQHLPASGHRHRGCVVPTGWAGHVLGLRLSPLSHLPVDSRRRRHQPFRRW